MCVRQIATRYREALTWQPIGYQLKACFHALDQKAAKSGEVSLSYKVALK